MTPDSTSAVFALLGAGLGAVTAVAVQWRVGVLAGRRLAHERRGRVNALIVSVFREFMAATKAVEGLSERREAAEPIAEDEVRTATARMWLSLQEVTVFCPEAIEPWAKRFVDALQSAVWHRPHVSVSEFLAEPRDDVFRISRPIFQEVDA